MKPSASRTMQPALDVLRILAALMVLTVHTGQLTGLEAQTAFGANGVTLFFILSGYLTQISLERTPKISAYYRRRALRILPLYWLTLAIRYLYDMVFALAAGIPAAEVFSLQGTCGPRWLRYVFFLQMWIPSDDWMLWNNRNVLWTMSAFAFFYLAAPWLHRLVERFRSRFAASFVLLLLCIGGKGTLGSRIEASLSALPQGSVDQISEFSAKTPRDGAVRLFAWHNPVLGCAGGAPAFLRRLLPVAACRVRLYAHGIRGGIHRAPAAGRTVARRRAAVTPGCGGAALSQRRELFSLSCPPHAAGAAAHPLRHPRLDALGWSAGSDSRLLCCLLPSLRAGGPAV